MAGGRVLATYLIANEESLRLDEAGGCLEELRQGRGSAINVRYKNHWARDAETPERMIIVDEDWLQNTYKEAGLEITQLFWGWWCGRPKSPGTIAQDVIIARPIP
ncbi:MAG: hypothetical protein Q8R76_01095 [Candidatus Omnitrophota bacterium]|nr:hypothetical protein [Candidatus Omnitrophota bacterium]